MLHCVPPYLTVPKTAALILFRAGANRVFRASFAQQLLFIIAQLHAKVGGYLLCDFFLYPG